MGGVLVAEIELIWRCHLGDSGRFLFLANRSCNFFDDPLIKPQKINIKAGIWETQSSVESISCPIQG